MIKRILITMLAVFTLSAQVFAQVKVTGKVTDTKGEAVIGASVLIQGTTTGTTTDLDGNYSISVPNSNSVLVFQFIGYSDQNVTVGNKSVINVTMTESAEFLEDVVVVAYGTSKRKDLTGSIGTISSDNIVAQAQGSVTRALEGQVAGLQTSISDGQPGVDIAIRVRGMGTASANNNNALIIIDGVPAIEGTNPLSSINGKDIESITVLKDAASTALYGARGANGVVLVTTKTGKQGKTKISFEARLGINAIGPKGNFDKVGDGDIADIYKFYWESIYNDAYYGKGNGTASMAGNATAAAEFASQHLFDYDGTVGDYHMNGLGNKMAYNVPGAVYNYTGALGTNSQSATMTGAYLINTDGQLNPNAQLLWTDLDEGSYSNGLLSNRFRQEYNVSATGGTDKVDYHVSMGYLSDPSYIAWSGFQRYTARANVNAQVTKWLKAGANFAYTNRTTREQSTRWGTNPGFNYQNVFRWTMCTTPLDQIYARNADGSIMTNENGEKVVFINNGYEYTNTANTYSPLGYTSTYCQNQNSKQFFEQAEWKRQYNDLNMKGYLKATFLKYFSFEANLAYDKTYMTTTRFWNTESAHGVSNYSNTLGSSIKRIKDEYSILNTQQLLNYAQDFGKHHVDALLGHEYYQYDFDEMSISQGHALLNDQQFYNNFLGTESYSTFGQGVGGSINKQTMESYFARANYIYDEKYYVSGSIRRDGSSKFKNDRWGTFWSVGAGWRMSSEPWMQGAKGWLDNLKLRGSYGVLGNQNGVGLYSGYQTWSYGATGYTAKGITTTSPTGYSLTKGGWSNDALTWERIRTADAGIDFTLFGGKVAGTFDWFRKHNVNAIWNKNSSYLASGQTSRTFNTAGIVSTGIEFDLSYQPVKTKDWDVILTVNGTNYKTTLVSIPEGEGYTYTACTDGWDLNHTETKTDQFQYLRGQGMDYYNLYFYKYGGVAGNTGKTYFGTDGKWHTGYTAGDVDAGSALFYHKVTASEVAAGTFGSSVKEGDDILVANSELANRYEMGSAIPKLFGGFSASMRYKGIDLSVQFSYQIGGKYMSLEYGSNECGKYMVGQNLRNGMAVSKEVMGNTWSENNLDAYFPMNFYSQTASQSGCTQGTKGVVPTDMALFDASYLSVKNITLGYTFPTKWMNKAKIANLRVYVSADNSLLFTAHSGYDPRKCMTGGLEVGACAYPYLAVYTFGINLDF